MYLQWRSSICGIWPHPVDLTQWRDYEIVKEHDIIIRRLPYDMHSSREIVTALVLNLCLIVGRVTPVSVGLSWVSVRPKIHSEVFDLPHP